MRPRRALALGIVLLLAFGVGQQLILAPRNPKATERVTVEIPKGAGVREIARRLQEAGVIRSPSGFVILVFLRGARGDLHAGAYELSPAESPPEILRRLTTSDTLPEDTAVTFPEGFTLQQMMERLTARGIVEGDAFLAAATADRFRGEFTFLTDAPAGSTLEGYLFPDTYRFFQGAGAEDVLRKMLQRFGDQFTTAQHEAQGRLPTTGLHEIVALASIVEREVRTADDRRLVAGILWRRFADGVGLDADATIRYITGNWDRPLTAGDLRLDSPYNTRRYRGLPPGPIGNPGLDSLRAALHPEPSDFHYYLSAPDGKTVFSKDLEEHRAARARYLPEGEFTGRE